MNTIVRPRLNDYHGILLLQDKVDDAIPFINEDIPLFVDPFLLWKSPSQMDNGIHNTILEFLFEYFKEGFWKEISG